MFIVQARAQGEGGCSIPPPHRYLFLYILFNILKIIKYIIFNKIFEYLPPLKEILRTGLSLLN